MGAFPRQVTHARATHAAFSRRMVARMGASHDPCRTHARPMHPCSEARPLARSNSRRNPIQPPIPPRRKTHGAPHDGRRRRNWKCRLLAADHVPAASIDRGI